MTLMGRSSPRQVREELFADAYAGMTDEEIELYVWEEILEDAYADVNRYGTRASVYGSEADSVIEGRQSAQETREEPDGQQPHPGRRLGHGGHQRPAEGQH